ncbi:hypothetical protein QYH69_23800 [Paraburkholderia sp. SARCC-3016]|uniref:hypothetical protein n=1 Tax=Paraburkholderia sp. SARCC-3016 TaxID=3058611 RepID=UPI0028073ECB|nr:hypothetical protein [Paraburkholderia sp. SARCC-3016]MDQ7980272.1 hypothetical protein [Paraburkholderia sp. SARCC-3016]
MNQRVNGHHGNTLHQTDPSEQMLEAAARDRLQQAGLRHARMLRNEMAAAFWKGKTIRGRGKILSPSAHRLASLGKRPRADAYVKEFARNTVDRDRSECSAQDPKNQHEHHHAHEHRDDRQEERQQRGRDDGEQQGEPQQQNRNGEQSQQQRSHDGHEKPSRPYARKASSLSAVPADPRPGPMLLLAIDMVGSPDLRYALANAHTKAALRLLRELGRVGHLLAAPFLLEARKRSSLLHSRRLPRLRSYRNASLAHEAANPGNARVVAKLHELSSDFTETRKRYAVEYSDYEQSIPGVKQVMLDESDRNSAARSASVSVTLVDSDKTVEVRTPTATPAANT